MTLHNINVTTQWRSLRQGQNENLKTISSFLVLD